MGKLFSGPKIPKPVPAPALPPPAPMVDQEAIEKEKRKKLALASKRSGRASTMLSEAGDTLG